MKTNRLFLVIVLVTLMSCEKNNDNPLVGHSYIESLAEWNNLKNVNGNSYVYETTLVSWVGFGNTTKLKIEEGIVTSRSYREFRMNEANGQSEDTDSYVETTTNIGIHNKGASPLTIDELYDTCAKNYLTIDKKNNTLYFETDENGLMTQCGFVPNECADDCYTGIWINSFNWID